jgi:hypothetical protein
LGYLASRPASPAAIWRQAVSLAAGALLVMLLLGRAGAFRPAAVAIVLAGALWVSTQATSRRCQPWPDKNTGEASVSLMDKTPASRPGEARP